MSDETTHNDAPSNDDDQSAPDVMSPEEARLEYELQVIRRMNQAFSSSLCMLEAARDDLVEMGHRMDRLRQASQQCRQAIHKKQASEQRQQK